MLPRPRRGPGWQSLAALVGALHLALVGAYIAYPVCSSRFDGWFLAFTAACVAHWFVLRGECWMNYLEKKLAYVDYALGDEPLRNWLFDALPNEWALCAVIALTAAMLLSLAAVAARTVLTHAARFAGGST
jgi:hypothetical protein